MNEMGRLVKWRKFARRQFAPPAANRFAPSQISDLSFLQRRIGRPL